MTDFEKASVDELAQLVQDMVRPDNGAVRHDHGKAALHLLPPDALLALAEHYSQGAAAHGERNWERGMDYHRVYNSLMRHALAWWGGEDIDPGSKDGALHVTAMTWNAMTLLTYVLRGIGADDRPRRPGR